MKRRTGRVDLTELLHHSLRFKYRSSSPYISIVSKITWHLEFLALTFDNAQAGVIVIQTHFC